MRIWAELGHKSRLGAGLGLVSGPKNAPEFCHGRLTRQMPDFLCENVGQMLVVLHDKVRFCVYSGIRTYPSAYTVYALGLPPYVPQRRKEHLPRFFFENPKNKKNILGRGLFRRKGQLVNHKIGKDLSIPIPWWPKVFLQWQRRKKMRGGYLHRAVRGTR